MDQEETLNQEPDETSHMNSETESKKENKLLAKLKKAGGFIKEQTYDKFAANIEKSKQEKELNKFFESKAQTFFISNRVICGIKGLDSSQIVFRVKDAALLGAGVEIKFDNQILEITDIDKKSIFNFTYNDKEYDLQCFKAVYKIKDKPASPHTVINQVTNTVTLGDGATLTGDIQQLAQISNGLKTIEDAIAKYNPGLFNKGKKDEATAMFVTFKSAINNETPKEKTFFDKFIKVLTVVAPTVVSIAKALWG